MIARFTKKTLLLTTFVALTACGGGGGGGATFDPDNGGGGNSGGGNNGGGSTETRVATASANIEDAAKGEFYSFNQRQATGIRGRYADNNGIKLEKGTPRRIVADDNEDHPRFKTTSRTLDFSLAPGEVLTLALRKPIETTALGEEGRVVIEVPRSYVDGVPQASNHRNEFITARTGQTTYVENQAGIVINAKINLLLNDDDPIEAYAAIDGQPPEAFIESGVAESYLVTYEYSRTHQNQDYYDLVFNAQSGAASASSQKNRSSQSGMQGHSANQSNEEYLRQFNLIVTMKPQGQEFKNLVGSRGIKKAELRKAEPSALGALSSIATDRLQVKISADVIDSLTMVPELDLPILKDWIRSQPGVYGVAENRTFSARAMSQRDNAQVTDIYENEAINSHLHTLNAAELIEASNFGDGITVCINDNAVNFDGSDIPTPAAQYDFSNDDASVSTESEDIHGSYVASMMLASPDNDGLFGFAHNARYLHAQVLGGDQSADVLVAGMEWCIDNGADIINQSLGFDNDVGHEYAVGFSPKVDAWREAGGVIFQAAGNSLRLDDKLYNSGEVGYVIVGATTRDYEFASFSNYGQELDVAAIGVAVPGFSHVANKGTENERDVFEYIDGTSFSTPLVASVYAAVRSVNPNFDGYWLDRILQSGDVTINEEELVGYMGNGALDADALYHAAKDLPASAGHLFATKYALHAVYDGASISFDLLSPDADVTVADISAPSIVGLTIDMEDDVDRGRVVVTLTADNIATLKASLNGAGQVTFGYGADSLPIRITGLFNADTVTASYPGEYFVVTQDGNIERTYFLENHGISSDDGVQLSIEYMTDDSIDAIDAVYICRQLTADKDEVAEASHCADITAEYNAGYLSDAANEHADILLRRGVYSPISQ